MIPFNAPMPTMPEELDVSLRRRSEGIENRLEFRLQAELQTVFRRSLGDLRAMTNVK
jgi:hypothetical protein